MIRYNFIREVQMFVYFLMLEEQARGIPYARSATGTNSGLQYE